jgi:hypothetical protein
MRALVIYESMYGNTHLIAERVADRLGEAFDTDVVPVGEATAERVAAADLVVVGGPTHVHGMSTARTRSAAAAAAAKPDATVALEDDATGDGLREWFDVLPEGGGRRAAAFDTRMSGPAVVTGRASKGITHRLRRHGFRIVADPQSFIVGKDNQLSPESGQAADDWARQLVALIKAHDAADDTTVTPR